MSCYSCLVLYFDDEGKLVETFSKHFGNIVQNLGIDGLANAYSDNDAVAIRKVIKISKSS